MNFTKNESWLCVTFVLLTFNILLGGTDVGSLEEAWNSYGAQIEVSSIDSFIFPFQFLKRTHHTLTRMQACTHTCNLISLFANPLI